jgi:hypothetical protein
MEYLMKDLDARKKLFEETPPEEVKYWFEYTGPLQVSESVSDEICMAFDVIISSISFICTSWHGMAWHGMAFG